MSTGRFDFSAVPLRQKALERPYCDGAIDIPAATGSLTGMRANPAADACQRVGIAGKLVSFLKSPFRDERDIPARVRVGWTSHHAGEVGVQPIPVHFFVLEPFQQDGNPQCVRLMESILLEEGTGRRADVAARSLFSYLLRVKSALLLPATATGLDWFLAPSCHTVTV